MFDSVIKPILELFKQQLRYSIGLGIIAASILFAPDSIIDKLGLLKLRDEGKPYFGIALVVCLTLAIASGIGFVVGKYNDHRDLLAGKKRLHRLTAEEKQILRGYIEGQTRSMFLQLNSGVVNGLADESIIYRSSSASNPTAGFLAFSYNIQPWAWDYLIDHRDLLRS